MSMTKAATASGRLHRLEETEMTETLVLRPSLNVVAVLLEHCDRCGAAAKLQVTFQNATDLAFCGHHANRYADRIMASARRVAIESGFLWRGGPGLTATT
jgi:hypothetical protein